MKPSSERLPPPGNIDVRVDGGTPQDAAGLSGNQGGATTLEWTLLLVAMALPSYLLIKISLDILLAHYRMISFINSLPFP